MADLVKALSLLDHGDWQAAHVIVQEDDSDLASWMHAIVHLLEGDTGNAGYWFRRAGQPACDTGDIEEALNGIRRQLEGR